MNKKSTMVFSVAAVAMMVIAGIAIVASSDTSSADDTQTVTYHLNGATGTDVSVGYIGIVATEYNPLYWNGSFDECPGNWTAPVESHNYGGSVGTYSVKRVFAGWSLKSTPTSSDDIYAPGDVIPSTVTDLYAFWALPDVFRVNNTNYQYVAAKTGTQTTPTAYGGTEFADRMYTTQYYISGTLNFGGNNGATLSVGSYRSQSAYGSGSSGTFNINGNVSATGNVVIDSVTMTSIAAGTNHGYATNAGIYANAHKLIIGTGIVNTFGTTANRAPQVYGGGTGSTGTTAGADIAFTNKSIVSKDDQLDGMQFNMGSYVIIHSGSYYNVMAAGRTTMGNLSNNPLSTYLVFKKATVLDSVGGGNSSTGSYDINASSTYTTQFDPYQGGTFIYAIGLTTLSDLWAANLTGYDQTIVTDEGANFQGGCSVGNVNGSTHVFVSGNSSVWDVQGGGRAGTSKCAFTYVEISGEAEVRHAACGLVTDGTGSANTCSNGTKIVVADNPRISMLFGAGYDTWTNPTASNMTAGKTIQVDIRGGTIGFVYGGGYRGTVGSNGNQLTVDVSISGGEILYDVFGGGRGGIDKMLRTVDGKTPSGNGYTNSTGQSVIYGDVTVTVTGTAHVHGNVYGGGESVPMLTRYYGTVFNNNDTAVNVAEVVGKTSVTVSGNAVIDGSVYGSGKGIDIENGTVVGTYTAVSGQVVTDYYTKNLVLSKAAGDDGWRFLEWYNHEDESGSITYNTTAASLTKYLEYARTNTNASVSVTGGTVSGSVYGGGAYSKTLADASVSISDGDIAVDVYGGGLGRLGNQSVASDSSVTITNGTIGGSVYGGSAYGIVSGESVANLNAGGTIAVAGSVYGGGLGSATYESVTGDSAVSVHNGSVTGSVYGGSAYGIINGSSTATIGGGSIAGAVYGGGLGTIDVNSVTGSSFVVMTAGDVTGSVYGGSAYGITSANSSASVSGGLIRGSLFGGGLGTAEHNSILGNSSATVSGGEVRGNVFGGCAYGITVGESRATINGGTIGADVYAGGLGTPRIVSVKGKRYLLMTGGTVMGSIYGGSSLGDDASSESAVDAGLLEESSSAYVTMTAGTVSGSVYGGGYKGVTTGTTYLYVGYSDFMGTESSGYSISIGNSIYGGGDVGELAPGQPMFTDTMVYGGSQVHVHGGNSMSFEGTISAAGNSCLTAGNTLVEIADLELANEIESVHRAQTVIIEASSLRLTGKVNGSGDNTKYAFYGIDDLTVKNGTTIYLYAPMGDIGEYSSVNSAGSYTKASAPLNRLNICNGTMFEVRKTVGGEEVYGNVNGYTILSIMTVENYYGALTLGSKGSPGGFVIEHDGSYTVTDKTDFTNCRCWFISGTLRTVASSTLIHDPDAVNVNDGGQYITIPTLSKSTDIRYTGGYFSPIADYELVDSDTPAAGQYSIKLGTNTEGRPYALLLEDGAGMYLPNTFDATRTVVTMTNRTEQPYVQFTVYGHSEDANRYLGYAVAYLQEVVEVKYKNPQGQTVSDYIVQNKIEVRIDLFNEGSAATVDDVDDTIETVGGTGSVDIIIPSRLSDYTVYLTGVETDLASPLSVASVKNNGGTTGWNYPLINVDVTGGFTGRESMQTLTGAFVATLRVTATGFNTDTVNHATFTFEIRDPEGNHYDDFTVNLTIKKHEPVLVTFVDETAGVVRPPYSFDYGLVITEADCPNTMDSFVGWYTDDEFINQFNFNTPLMNDMTLYARYMHTVTFDYQNGMGSTMYVDIVAGGMAINKPAEPTWDGYTFQGWFKEPTCLTPWVFADSDYPDVVVQDTTLYAKWVGINYLVSFKYELDGSVQYLQKDGQNFTINVAYGSPYGTGIDTATSLMMDIIAGRQDFLFVRWQLPLSSDTSLGIYSDTLCSPPATVVYDEQLGRYTFSLEAQFAADALNVVLDKNTTDASAKIEAPASYLLYTDDEGYYNLSGNNATRTGYRITGWAFDAECTDLIPIGTDLRFSKDDAHVSQYISDNTLRLYAKWELIEYTITIVQPVGGQIRGNYSGVDYYDEIHATYGQTIYLNYSDPTGSYQFARWVINGQSSLVDAESSSTTLTVIGSCAIYAQLRALEPVTVNLYLDGGTSATPDTVELYLMQNGTTYAMLPRLSVQQDDSGKYYGVYTISSKMGTFGISIRGAADGRMYDMGSVSIFDTAVTETVYAVTVKSEVTGASLTGLPLYVRPGDTVTFGLPEGYEIDGKISVTANGGTTELDVMSYTVSSTPTSGVVFTGNLKLIEWTVNLQPNAGFTYKENDVTVTQIVRQYGNIFGTLPVMYDSGGIEVGTDASPYLFIGWFYDSSFLNEVSADDVVAGNMTIYPYYYLRDNVPYRVHIYMMEIGGEYPEIPTYNNVHNGLEGQETTLVPETFEGFTLVTPASVYTDFILVKDMIIELQYSRMFFADPVISVGEGTASLDGWTFVQGTPNTLTKSALYYGEVITLPTVVREGYTHTGWLMDGAAYESASYTATTVSAGALVFPDFESVMTINVWKLTINTSRELTKFSDGTTSKVFDVTYGTVIEEVPGYEVPLGVPGYITFNSWLDGATPFDVSGTMPDRNLTLTAFWDIAKFTLEFTGDDHTEISAISNGVELVSGTEVEYNYVTFTIVYDISHKYLSHSIDGAAEGELTYIDRHNYTYRILLDTDTAVSFLSQESRFTVSYFVDYRPGDDPVKSDSILEGTEVEMLDYQKKGYDFHGWYSNPDYSVLIDTISPLALDWSLFGYTTPKHYIVSFDANGGTGTTESVEMVYDSEKALSPNGFAQEGARFLGWSDADDTGVKYNDGESVMNVSDTGDDITLYAVWLYVNAIDMGYDGTYHYPPVTGAGVTVYYSFTELNDENYQMGTTDPDKKKDVGSYLYYYYAKDTKVAMAGSVSMVIRTVPLNIRADDITLTYGGAPQFTATYTGLMGEDTPASLTGTLVYDCSYAQYDDIGSFPIAVSGQMSGNYDITFTGGTLTVVQKEIVLQWAGLSLTYNASPQKPSATAGGLVNGDECNVTVTGEQTDAGTYTATASALSNGNYKLPAVSTAEFTIAKKTLTIVGITVPDKVYNGNVEASIEGTAEISGIEGTDVLALSGSPVAAFASRDAGNAIAVSVTGYTITGDKIANYQYSQPSFTAAILKQPIRLVSASAEKTYNGTALTAAMVTLDDTVGRFVGTEGFTYEVTGTRTEAGIGDNTFEYTLNPNTLAGNYDIEVQYGTLNVHYASLKNISYAVYAGQYDGAEHPVVTSMSAVSVNDQPITWTFSRDGMTYAENITVCDATDSGTYYYKVSAPNHNTESGTFTVSIGSITVDVPSVSGSVYTGEAYVPEVPASELYGVDSNPGGTNAGTYYVRLVLTDPDNYDWRTVDTDYVDIEYAISKAQSSAVLQATPISYDGSAHALLVEQSVTGGTIGYGMTEGSYAAEIPERTDAGTYKVYWKVTGDNNHLDSSGSVSATIVKGTPVLTATVVPLVYDGNTLQLITVTASTAEVTVLYSLDGGPFVSAIPAGVNAGTYSVKYKSEATDNYVASTVGEATVTIAKALYDRAYIHFNDASYRYDATEKALLITTDAGHDLPSEITPVYQNNTGTDVGTYDATVTFDVGDNYLPIEGMSATLEIYVTPIVYTAVPYNATYDGLAHAQVTVSVTSPGATVMYSDAQAGTYVPDCPTITSAGTGSVWYRITALGYTDVEASATYNVSKVTISVSSATVSRQYDGTPLTAGTVSLVSGTLAAGHHLSGEATGTITNVGSVDNPFTVSVLDSSDDDVTANYDILTEVGKLTVIKARFNASYIHFDDKTVPYDGTEKSLTIRMEEGHPLPSEITPVYQNNTGTAVGEYAATVTFTVSSNYEAIDGMSALLTIYESTIDFSVSAYSATYDGLPHAALTITVNTAGSTVTYSLTGTGEYVAECPTVMDAGTTTVWYRIVAEGHDTVNLSATATVSKRSITVTSDDGSKVYDGTPLTAPGLTLDGELATGHALDGAATASITNAGKADNVFTVSVLDAGDNDVTANYSILKINGELTISKAVFDRSYIHFADTSYQYDGTEKALLITTDAGHDLPSEITPVYQNNTGTEVGEYSATVTFTVSSNYVAIEGMAAVMTIFESQMEFTVTAYTGTYDGLAHPALNVSVTTPGAAVSYSADGQTYVPDCPEVTDAGTTQVWYKIELLGYTTVTQSANSVVSKIVLSVSSNSGSKVYDGTPLTAPGLTLNSGTLVSGHRIASEATGTITGAGQAANPFTTVILNSDDNDVTANYDVYATTGTLTVSKANAAIIIIASEPVQYDGNLKNLDYLVTGLAPGDEIEANLGYSGNHRNAGTYNVFVDTWRFITGTISNYNVDKSSQETLTILPTMIEVPAADTTLYVYDGTQKTYAIAASNLYNVTGNTQVYAGSYSVTVSLRDHVNYAWSTGSSDNLVYQFDIGKRTLRVVADQVSKVYGEDDPVFTCTTYGEAPGETAGLVGSPAAASHNIGVNDITVGTLVIGNNGAFRAANYDFVFEGEGRFTITPLMVELPEAPGYFGVLYYTGEEITAYAEGDYYTAANGSATDVGIYTATLTLKDTVNYVWSDTRDSADRNLQYSIVLAKINVQYSAYSGVYDALTHDAVTILDADGSTVYFGFEMMGWTTDVPVVRNVEDSGTLYIKAVKLNHEDFYAEVPYEVIKARLDVYADDQIISLTDDLPEFTFRAEGFVGSEGLSDLTCEILFGTSYRPGDAWGYYPIDIVGSPADHNYEIVAHSGTLTVASKVTVVWKYTEYIYTKAEQRILVDMVDEAGNVVALDAYATDSDGNPVEFRDVGKYTAIAALPEGYVLDPDSTVGLTAELEIVENEAFEINWLIVSLVIIIVTIAVHMVFDIHHRRP